MKIKIIILVWLLAYVCGLRCYAAETPIVSFDKTTVDFGEFSETNARQRAVFSIHNTGNAPLIIISVRATCGCTTPTYTKTPIMPGKTGTIIVDYNGRNRAKGPFSKSIYVRTNASRDQIRLQIKGNMQSSDKKAEK